MTEEEKRKIARFREKGLGYKKIAQLTGISTDTVKAHCRRKGLTGAINDPDLCPCCGGHLERIPGRKPKRFCCDQCRNKWWNAHLDLVKRKAVYEFICPACGKTFSAYGNSNRKYCCHDCYIADRFGNTHNK